VVAIGEFVGMGMAREFTGMVVVAHRELVHLLLLSAACDTRSMAL